MDNDTSLTIREVAGFLNISNQMVYNLIRAGELPAFKVGSAVRVLKSDLLSWVQSRKTVFSAQNREYDNPDDSAFSVQSLFVQVPGFRVENVSFSLPRGKILAILGASGSGKTLLLKALAGIIRPAAGAVFLGTARIDGLSPQERHIGFVYQDYALFPNMKSRENIGFPLHFMNLSRDKMDGEVDAVVRELRIDDSFLRKYPDQLPEGIKQLIAIGREKTHAMELYIMDEPMSHLDARIRVEMRSFIKQLVIGLGKTTIITVNSPEDALALSDYTGVLDRGKLIQYGPTREVYSHPDSLVVMNMLSANGVNCLPVQVSGGRIDTAGIRVNEPEGSYLLAFRPEEVEMTEAGISAEVKRTVFYDGKRFLADCRTGDGREIRLLVPAETGETVTFVPTHPVLFPG